MMKQVTSTLALLAVLATAATAAPTTTYNLTQDAGLALTNPVGNWTFQYASHTPAGWGQGSWEQNPANYVSMAKPADWDWNAAADGGLGREIWHYPGAWSNYPAVYINNYTSSSARTVSLMISDTADSIVKWTSQGNDTATIAGTFSSQQSQGAMLWITKYTGSGLDTNLLLSVWADSGTTTPFNLITTVNAGDVLYFRKTYWFAPDSVGKQVSVFDVSVTVPEPACLGLLGLAVLGLLRRRRN